MASVGVKNNIYTVESVYQWDINRILEISGLSLASPPEIHFASASVKTAIVKQSTMSAAGVIKVQIPNELLQKAEKIKAYIYVYENGAQKTEREITIPVIARAKPSDYVTPDDGPIVSPPSTGGGDYEFTEADKQEIVKLVLAALPNGDEVSY